MFAGYPNYGWRVAVEAGSWNPQCVSRATLKKIKDQQARAFSAQIGEHADDHLALLEAELFRLRASTNQKLTNTYTKATVLVGATGILGSVTVAATDANAYVLAADLALYIAAAVLGIMALRTKRGDEVDLAAIVAGGSAKTEVSLRRSIIASNFRSHLDYESSLAERSRAVTVGFALLASAFLIFSADKAWQAVFPTTPPAAHVIIDKGHP
jgi:hypothetical protein